MAIEDFVVTIGGHDMPASMNNRALNYVFERAKIIGRNGEGAAIASAGGCAVLWVWAYLDATEFDYLNQTLLDAAPSATFTGVAATMRYNERHELEAFDHAIVLRPTYKALSGVTYHEVTLVIDSLW
jgi:hypothetical protein